MSRGQLLEKNLTNIMRSFFTPTYWPNRSGLQNGYDSYAKFNIKGKEYFWKFECKDYNRNKHVQDYSDVAEIEISDFSDKIMEIMSLSESYYPHVFCLFIPHKSIGNNNTFRERLTSWNIFNKLPFKIVIWDFDFLGKTIPFLNLADADSIYPNATNKNKSEHDAKVKVILTEIEQQSVDGYLHNRSYIRERQAKNSVLVDDVLHIKIDKLESQGLPRTVSFDFTTGADCFTFSNTDLTNCNINLFPYRNSAPEDLEINPALIQSVEPETAEAPEQIIFDESEYLRMISESKAKIISIFKSENSNRLSIFNIIKNFCSQHTSGIVSFVCPKDVFMERLPIKELNASDFESTNNIHFYFEFRD